MAFLAATRSSRRCRRCGCGQISRAMCCATSRPRNAPAARRVMAPRSARYSMSREAVVSSLTTIGVDTTPLFVMLAGAYYTRTADLDLMSALWPSITAALRWIDVYGDVDGDGFVETRPRGASPPHHGWKSAPDAVFHADGRVATGPLALCEVQGYVYAARLAAARIARSLGETSRAIALVEAAQALQLEVQQRLLVQGHRDLRDRARRRQTTLPCAHVEPGPLPVHRHRTCRARTPGHRRTWR